MTDKPRLHAFVDESFSLPSSAGNRTFYILAAALVNPEEFEQVRSAIAKAYLPDFMHSSDLLRSAQGRADFTRLCSSIPSTVEINVFFLEPLLSGDRNGELSRTRMFEQVCQHLAKSTEFQVTDLVYEIRRDGFMRQADIRTAKRLNQELSFPWMRPQSPRHEKLLWIPDIAAAAFRQSQIWNNHEFLESFQSKLEIQKI